MKTIKKFTTKHLLSFVLVVLLITSLTFTLSVNANELVKDADVSFKAGELLLVDVPNINFKINIPNPRIDTKHTFGALEGEFQIQDTRGTLSGWSISASLSGFDKVNDSAGNTLNGAYLRLWPAKIEVEAGKTSTITSYPVELIAGDGIFHKYIVAPPNTQNGLWKAKVPGGELVIRGRTGTEGNYKAKITWNLEDTP